MISPSLGTLRHHSSSPDRKHGPSVQLLPEDPAHTQNEKTLNSSLYNIRRKTWAWIETVDQCGDMASRTAHDLTNILTAIQGNTELAALDSASGFCSSTIFAEYSCRQSTWTRMSRATLKRNASSENLP